MAEILGEESDDESGSGSDEDDSEEEEGESYLLCRPHIIQSTHV
jgi:hypothetical protein